jgi:hypothetical protein
VNFREEKQSVSLEVHREICTKSNQKMIQVGEEKYMNKYEIILINLTDYKKIQT